MRLRVAIAIVASLCFAWYVLHLGHEVPERTLLLPMMTEAELQICQDAHMVNCHVRIDQNGRRDVYGDF